jgi:hypothetical protein
MKGARKAHELRNGRFLRDLAIYATVLTEIWGDKKKQAFQDPGNRQAWD